MKSKLVIWLHCSRQLLRLQKNGPRNFSYGCVRGIGSLAQLTLTANQSSISIQPGTTFLPNIKSLTRFNSYYADGDIFIHLSVNEDGVQAVFHARTKQNTPRDPSFCQESQRRPPARGPSPRWELQSRTPPSEARWRSRCPFQHRSTRTSCPSASSKMHSSRAAHTRPHFRMGPPFEEENNALQKSRS